MGQLVVCPVAHYVENGLRAALEAHEEDVNAQDLIEGERSGTGCSTPWVWSTLDAARLTPELVSNILQHVREGIGCSERSQEPVERGVPCIDM